MTIAQYIVVAKRLYATIYCVLLLTPFLHCANMMLSKETEVTMDNRERLERSQRIDIEIQSQITNLESLMELAKKLDAASGNVLLKQSCLCSMMTPTLSKLYDLQLEAAQKIEQLMWEKDNVIAAINAVDNQTYRIILVSRYLNGEAWPDIAAELNYDLRHVYRLHNAALEAIRFSGEAA